MPNYGFGVTALGAGAQEGLQALLKQRLLERQMALAEQAQRENSEYRNRDLDLRSREAEEARALREAVANQNAYYQEGQLVDRAASNTPYDQELDVPTAAKFKAFAQPVSGPSLEERVSPLANEELPPYRFKGNMPRPEPKGAPVKIRGAGGQPEFAYPEDAIGKVPWTEPNQGRSPYEGQRVVDGVDAKGGRVQRLIGPRGETISEWPVANTQVAKPPTGVQRAAVKYFDRMREAIADFSAVAPELAKQGLAGQLQTIGPNLTQTSAQRRYNNALARYTEARLRKDSGAAVPPEEYRKDLEVYGIRPGDDPETIKQKVRAMISTANALAIEAGNSAMTEQYGEGWQGLLQNIVSGGSGGGTEIEYDINGNPIRR